MCPITGPRAQPYRLPPPNEEDPAEPTADPDLHRPASLTKSQAPRMPNSSVWTLFPSPVHLRSLRKRVKPG
ncbi:hypothetical protein DPEC_G00216090 [Dallia pectoralis]|uniref:Uncharacterized protein n=1 Tax=Dallia pectoralis TaxID=75939 RepID=A0ACC2G2H5_DALPE|nr:hypothetical protein DPEC_G00216090 [Dallia pectoralis]